MPATQATPADKYQYRQHGATQFNVDLAGSQEPDVISMHTAAMAAIWEIESLTVPLSEHVPEQVDGVLRLCNGREHRVELKTRRPAINPRTGRPWTPRDVLIEDCLITRRGRYKGPGWRHQTPPADAILSYAWVGTGLVFVTPHATLLSTAIDHWDGWTSVYKTIQAPTRDVHGQINYWTLCLPVAIDVLLLAVPGAVLVNTETGAIRYAVDGQIYTRNRTIPDPNNLASIITSPSRETLKWVFGPDNNDHDNATTGRKETIQ